jgi:hypothetical protein
MLNISFELLYICIDSHFVLHRHTQTYVKRSGLEQVTENYIHRYLFWYLVALILINDVRPRCNSTESLVRSHV